MPFALHRRIAPAIAAGPGRFLARYVMLGLGLAAALPAAPQQTGQAAPLGLPARVEGAAAKDLDPATVNLDWEDVAVADLPLLARFPGLRRLQINPNTDAGKAAWESVTADALAPLCTLPGLEDLTLPYCAHLSVEHLRRLATCKRLASVWFINESLTLDTDVVAVLATWPALRSLRLSLIEVTPPGLAALGRIENLDSLELASCRGLDAAGMAAVGRLTKLRALSLEGLGKPDMMARFKGLAATPSWALDAAAMQQIAAMPALRELELQQCALEPRLLKALPKALAGLTLEGEGVDVPALQELRQHGSLRALRLREAGETEAQREQFRKEVAGLLGTLRLERFTWFGALSVDLRQAIASQADLRELAVPCGPDLGFATALPKLERLELWQRIAPSQGDGAGTPAVGVPAALGPPTPAELAVLQPSKSLRVVAYHDVHLAADLAAGLRKALGGKIALQLVQ